MRVLKDNQVFGSPDETYGKDVNTIVRAIMESDERPKEIKSLFETVRIVSPKRWK